jgi:hypothetical protein
MSFKIFFTSFVFLSLLVGYHQRSDLQDLAQKLVLNLTEHQDEFPTEKVFVHFDRQFYSAGDDIWFSVFVSAGHYQIPSELSKVVYVDFLSPNGTLIEQRRVEINQGRGQGDFKIPLIIEEGNFRIRAYTNWMKNFGEEYFFHKDIVAYDPFLSQFQPYFDWGIEESSKGIFTYSANFSLLNKTFSPLDLKEISLKIKDGSNLILSVKANSDSIGKGKLSFVLTEELLKKNPSVEVQLNTTSIQSLVRKIALPYPDQLMDVQFFPEGGNFLLGVQNRIAFQSNFPNGRPATFNGRIVNSKGEQQATFETNINGFGSFLIQAQSGESYYAIFETKTGEIRKQLPEAQMHGVSLQVDNLKPNFVRVKVMGSSSEDILVLVHSRGMVNHIAQGRLEKNEVVLSIPKDKLLQGVNHITVFNSNGIPLAERLIFTDHEDDLSLNVVFYDFNFDEKEKGVLEISAKDKNGKQVAGTFSISITDDFDSFDLQDENHIKSHLLLQSDIKGRINNPAYYFQDNNLGLKQDLDLLLLTQGWRRFNWEEIIEGKLKETPNFIEQGINITGSITDNFDFTKRLKGGEITTYLHGTESEFLISSFDESGKFIIPNLHFYDTAQVTILMKDKRFLGNLRIKLDEPLNTIEQTEILSPRPYGFEINSRISSYLDRKFDLVVKEKEFSRVIQLDELVVKGRRIPSEDDVIKMYGSGDFSIIPGERHPTTGHWDLFSYLQGKVPGLVIQSIGGVQANIYFRRNMGQFDINNPPNVLMMVNDVPVQRDFFFNLPLSQIAAIEIFRDPATTAIFGSAGGPGVIAVYTKKGLPPLRPVPGLMTFQFPGYNIPREFYQPNYELLEDTRQEIDIRTTLLWNPSLNTSESESSQIHFYNSDRADRIRITVQGMDNWGRLGYFSKAYAKED